MAVRAGWSVIATLSLGLAAGPVLAQGAPGTETTPPADPIPNTDTVPPPDTAPRSGPSIGAWVDNDLFGGGTDRYYTNGVQFYYVSGERPTYGNIDWLANLVPWIGEHGVRRYGIAFGQNMYTPSDITKPIPDPTDRPYAGWLYGRLSVISEETRQVDRIDLDLGMVGPASLAEQTQKAVHRIVPGARWPEGWDYQLKNEPGIILSYEHVWRAERPARIGPFEADISPHVAGSVGNILTFGGAGVTMRLGGNMAPPVGALILRPTASIPYQDSVAAGEPRPPFSWYVYAGAEGRAVARNIFLDGSSFRDSRSVDKHNFVAAFQLGVALRYGPFGISYAQNFLSPEFEGQKSYTNYGSIRASYRF